MLVVVHEMTLTGAPMNALHFVRWLTRNTDVEVQIIALADGPLRHRFEASAPVVVLDRRPAAKVLATAQAGLMHLGSTRAWKAVARARLGPQLRNLRGYDLVYANSITSSAVLPHLPPAAVTVSHVHELQVAVRTWREPAYVAAFEDRPDAWIAASLAVRDMLVNERGFDAESVLLHHEFIDARRIADRDVALREIERTRRSLGIPADASIVVGAGTIDWRKGPDLFVQLATEVRRRTREPVRFVWVGGDLTGADWERVRSDIERTGSDHVHFVGMKPDPLPWFAMADVFALTSREDPFPLVCLEAAALGLPIVTYRNGGMPELLHAAGSEAAVGIVDHLDVGAMADRIIAMIEIEHLRERAGLQVRQQVLDHHDVDVAAPRLYADLCRLVEQAGDARPSPLPEDEYPA
jgi:glycosyltransferase involved in cell wall biosynthesis